MSASIGEATAREATAHEATAHETPALVRVHAELDAPDPLALRVATALLLVVLLPIFALAFLAALTLAVALLPLALPIAFVFGPRGALPHEARASPSHRGARRDISRA